MDLELQQSLPLCCGLSALGGVLEVAATALTAVPSVREREGVEMTVCKKRLAVAGNVTLQLIGSVVSHLIAPWFGPVSLVVPFYFSASLLSNMVIFGMILREEFNKSMRVGTYVITVAVILLPVVGPGVQEGQDITYLMHRIYADAWFLLLLLGSSYSCCLLCLGISKYSMRNKTIVLIMARSTSMSLNLTVSRAFVLDPGTALLVSFIIIKVFSGAVYTYAIVVQSTEVVQSRFVPLCATIIILVNAFTGIIFWQDWKVVASWYGYCCVFVLLALGCDLLLSVPLLIPENSEFGNQLIVQRRRALSSSTHPVYNMDAFEHYSEIPDICDAANKFAVPDISDRGHKVSHSDMSDKESIISDLDVTDRGSAVPREPSHMHLTWSDGWTDPNPHTVAFSTPSRPAHDLDVSNMPHASIEEYHGPLLDSRSERTLSRREAWKLTISPIRPLRPRSITE